MEPAGRRGWRCAGQRAVPGAAADARDDEPRPLVRARRPPGAREAATSACVRAVCSLAALIASLSLPPPSSPLHVRNNSLGTDVGTALAQSLSHLPLYQLDITCALAAAQPARNAGRGGAARTYRARVCLHLVSVVGVCAVCAQISPTRQCSRLHTLSRSPLRSLSLLHRAQEKQHWRGGGGAAVRGVGKVCERPVRGARFGYRQPTAQVVVLHHRVGRRRRRQRRDDRRIDCSEEDGGGRGGAGPPEGGSARSGTRGSDTKSRRVRLSSSRTL